MRITSPSFSDSTPIPAQFTCDGKDLSPQLELRDVPEDTQSLTLIVHDPDAPSGNWVHWLLWNISPDVKEIPEGTVPAGVIQGTTSSGSTGYHGPCPPSGTHRYIFDLYALDTALNLPSTATDVELKAAMSDHIITQATLTGLYKRE